MRNALARPRRPVAEPPRELRDAPVGVGAARCVERRRHAPPRPRMGKPRPRRLIALLLQRADVLRGDDQAVEVVVLLLVAAAVEVRAEHPVVEEDARVLLIHQRHAGQVADELSVDPQPQVPVSLAGTRELRVELHAVPLARFDLVRPGHVEGRPVRHAAVLAEHLGIPAVAPLLPRRRHADERVGRLPEVEVHRQVGIRRHAERPREDDAVVRPVALWPLPAAREQAVVAAVHLGHFLEANVHPAAGVALGVADLEALTAGAGLRLRPAGDREASVGPPLGDVVPAARRQAVVLEILPNQHLRRRRAGEQQEKRRGQRAERCAQVRCRPLSHRRPSGRRPRPRRPCSGTCCTRRR
jgi:hypothetical protein